MSDAEEAIRLLAEFAGDKYMSPMNVVSDIIQTIKELQQDVDDLQWQIELHDCDDE